MKKISKLFLLGIVAITTSHIYANNVGLIGLKDMAMGSIVPADKNIQQEQSLCVYSIPNGHYQVLLPLDSNPQLQLTSQTQHGVPVQVFWNGVELTPGVPSVFMNGATTEQTINCGNAVLKYVVINATQSRMAGLYLHHLHLEVSSHP